ncbi:sigma-E factor negative regulatory protein RseA [Povalibacter uvarum]|uniref:Sigma-E factor negative regulatory protein RseA n=1 Tax=Povalibacter uvarum TaxID=732238 RepID=A0A841HG96_9GAMM|nr:sigma-E factor negative regulatory protein [Povalibacter uvarum]MBB6091796.1 sigma-E factor negative regulatory protein RseA [Povalibacter uvarum]
MTDPVKEQLSACLDGELPEAELGLLLKQLQRDPQLRQSMGSYSLIGEAMRGPGAVRASSGFADRIAAAIAEEPIANAPARKVTAVPRWMRPATGFAVAAGVAAVAVVSLQPATIPTQQVAGTQTIATTIETADQAIAPSYTVPTNVEGTGSAFIPAARLTNYVVAHSEYSSPLGRRTVLSGVLSEDDDDQEEESVLVTGTPQESTAPAAESAGPRR